MKKTIQEMRYINDDAVIIDITVKDNRLGYRMTDDDKHIAAALFSINNKPTSIAISTLMDSILESLVDYNILGFSLTQIENDIQSSGILNDI